MHVQSYIIINYASFYDNNIINSLQSTYIVEHEACTKNSLSIYIIKLAFLKSKPTLYIIIIIIGACYIAYYMHACAGTVFNMEIHIRPSYRVA